MKKKFSIGEYNTFCVWIDEMPFEPGQSDQKKRMTIEGKKWLVQKSIAAAIEVFIAPRYYALLGAEYTYKNSQKLDVKVNITNNCRDPVKKSLALPSDNVWLGISDEYSQTILDQAIKEIDAQASVPSGVLLFHTGAHSDYGSNQSIFSKATKILISLLFHEQKYENSEQVEQIIRNAMKEEASND